MRQAMRLLFLVLLLLLLDAGAEGRAIYRKSRSRLRPWNIFTKNAWIVEQLNVEGLEYYVQLALDELDLQQLIAPINSTTSNTFGQTNLFALNVTEGVEANSTQLGYMRGYTVQASYTTTTVGLEVEALSYDDGTINGTVIIEGLVTGGPNEVAVVGGTGDFRGVSGYGIVSFVNVTDNILHFLHQLHFL